VCVYVPPNGANALAILFHPQIVSAGHQKLRASVIVKHPQTKRKIKRERGREKEIDGGRRRGRGKGRERERERQRERE
jgi:hypothetical protein